MRENAASMTPQKTPAIFGVQGGVERRRQTSLDVPLPVRPFDTRGRKPDKATGRLSILSWIPKAGTFVDIARLSEIGYSVVKGAVDGDELRMPDGARELKPEQKEQYVMDYMLNRFDRANRIAKIAYHRKKGFRAMRRAAGNAVTSATSLAAEIFVPGYRELGYGLVGAAVTVSFGVDALVESGLVIREFDEARQIGKRSGKMRRGIYHESTAFLPQLAKAVEIIGLSDDPRGRERITARLASRIDNIRRVKSHAFDTLERETPGKVREIKQIARKLERLDYLIDHPTRPLAMASRLIKERTLKLKPLIDERQRLRNEEVYVYDQRYGRYNKAKNVPGYQG